VSSELVLALPGKGENMLLPEKAIWLCYTLSTSLVIGVFLYPNSATYYLCTKCIFAFYYLPLTTLCCAFSRIYQRRLRYRKNYEGRQSCRKWHENLWGTRIRWKQKRGSSKVCKSRRRKDASLFVRSLEEGVRSNLAT
jgi:hypothetical protein